MGDLPDEIVKANLTLAIGLDALSTISQSKEASGILIERQNIVCRPVLALNQSSYSSHLLFKISELLERADDEAFFEFEYEVLLIT